MIEINNLTTRAIDENFLRKTAKSVLGSEDVNRASGLSIVLIGSRRMRKLNQKYRGKNRVTDVLSFAGPTKKNLGEIVLCLQEIGKNAKKANSSFEKELTSCLIHGLLHLLGYEHEKSGEEAGKMEKRQEGYLLKVLNT